MSDAKKDGTTYTVRDKATGKEFELKSRGGTTGPDVVDIRNLFTGQGLFTYDPGYGSTASSSSAWPIPPCTAIPGWPATWAAATPS